MATDIEKTGFSTLPMDLQMFAFELNKLMSELLFVRIDRTKIMVDTAQALIENDQQEAERRLEHMYSTQTITSEWQKIEEIKARIGQEMEDNLHLFTAANNALRKAGKPGIDLAELQLPIQKLEEVKARSEPETIYDCIQEYNEILNNFLSRIIELCGELSMALVRI